MAGQQPSHTAASPLLVATSTMSCLRPEGSRTAAWHAFPGVWPGGVPTTHHAARPIAESQGCHSVSALLLQAPPELAAALKRLARVTCAPGYSCTNSKCKATSGKPDDMFVIELNPGTIKFTSVAQGLMVSSVPDLRTLCVWSCSACRCTCCQGLRFLFSNSSAAAHRCEHHCACTHVLLLSRTTCAHYQKGCRLQSCTPVADVILCGADCLCDWHVGPGILMPVSHAAASLLSACSVCAVLQMLAARTVSTPDAKCSSCGSATTSRWALQALPEGLVGISINRLQVGMRDWPQTAIQLPAGWPLCDQRDGGCMHMAALHHLRRRHHHSVMKQRHPVDVCMAGPFAGCGTHPLSAPLPRSGLAPSPAVAPVLKADHKHVQSSLLLLQYVQGGEDERTTDRIYMDKQIMLMATSGPNSGRTGYYALTAVIMHTGSRQSGHIEVRLFLKPPPCIPDQHTCGCVCRASGCWASGIAQHVLGSHLTGKAAADVPEAAGARLGVHAPC